MESPTLVTVDPEGDVTLLCGESQETFKIRVSSYTLGRGSSVFKSMLAPRFKEGMTLETSSSVEIPLPEDDPVGMSMLCHIIHLRNNAIAHKPDVGLIHKVATLADKYDCAEAVKHAAWSWISQHLGTTEIQSLYSLLRSADYFRHEECLQKIGCRLVLLSTGPIGQFEYEKHLIAGSSDIAVVLLSLENVRKEAFKYAATVIEDRIDKQRKTHNSGYECPKNCHDLDVRFGCLVDSLVQLRLWPVSALQTSSLHKVIETMSTMTLNEPTIVCENRWHNSNARYPLFNQTTAAIKTAAKRIEGYVSELCFECIREGTAGVGGLQIKCNH